MALRSTHSERSLLAKKRVIRMLVVVVLVFAICWTPLYSLFLYVHYCNVFDPKGFNIPVFQVLYKCFLMLAYCSTCTNPIAYCFLNRKFRQAFLLAFGCRRWAGKDLTIVHTNSYHPAHGGTKSHSLGGSAASGRRDTAERAQTRLFVPDRPQPNSARRVLRESSPTLAEDPNALLLSLKAVSLDKGLDHPTSPSPAPACGRNGSATLLCPDSPSSPTLPPPESPQQPTSPHSLRRESEV